MDQRQWTRSDSLTAKLSTHAVPFLNKPEASSATLNDLRMLRTYFETAPLLGLALQGICVYTEGLRNAMVAAETSNTLKGHTRAFAALGKLLEEEGKTRDSNTIRGCLGNDLLLVRAHVDAVLGMLEKNLKAIQL
eukprot:5896501-Amphidinium_carterae.1